MAIDSANGSVWTPANKVTFVRIILIPVFVAILIGPWPQYFPAWMDMSTFKPWLAAGVFIVLSLTDMLDGYLARSRGEVTDFGKFMDPLADKLLVTAALLGLIELDVLPSWAALVIVSREFIVSGVRMVAASKGEVIAASMYGKVKTVFQMIAIVLFIVKDSHVITDINTLFHDGLYLFSWAIMFIALALTIISMVDYLIKARDLIGFSSRRLRKRREEPESSGSGMRETERDGEYADAPSREEIEELSAIVLEHARGAGMLIATAESCTGGMIAAALTAIAGSSDAFAGGIVSYSNSVKEQLLDVEHETLQGHGAVSEEVACEMARGAMEHTGCDVAVSVTGIAGPGGAVPGKPVGTVWIGVADGRGVRAHHYCFSGLRDVVRLKTVKTALTLVDDSILEQDGI